MYKADFFGSTVIEWSVGGELEKHRNYHPACYVSATTRSDLHLLKDRLDSRGDVKDTGFEQWRTDWQNAPEDVLRVDARTVDAVSTISHTVRRETRPGRYRLFNVDLSPQFRYCLERSVPPLPTNDPSTCTIMIPEKRLHDQDISRLSIDGETHTLGEPVMVQTVQDRIDTVDPDILVLSSAELVPLLYRKAEEHDVPFQLGRMAGWSRLAGRSTYHSYGRTGNSPARYNVPGRAIIDTSNSFFYNEANLDGLMYMVEQSWKPVQECAWASIGNALTAMQIRTAHDRGVLVQWQPRRPETFKTMRQLHDADRGGFIFSPKTGIHEDVYECDFSSLYPNIMITRNISPDTVRCDCCDNTAVPGLGYSICEEQDGYLADVLQPLIDDRNRIKERIRETDDPEERDALHGMSEAIKLVLCSCFGYQGHANAKFGRISAHESINAYAREILLDTKDVFEDHGWEIVHGIVDSIWATPASGEEQTPITTICDLITADTGITLENDNQYEWIGFCPKRSTDTGALTRYFGKTMDGGFKVRGIETRQRSTPAYIADCQRTLLETLDRHRSPDAVCNRLKRQIRELQRQQVEPDRLLTRKRVSQPVDQYRQYTRTVAALERAAMHGFPVHPGEDVRYVVVNDDHRSPDRVRLHFEDVDTYDADHYTDQLIRATESLLSVYGWDRHRIRDHLADTTNPGLHAFMNPQSS